MCILFFPLISAILLGGWGRKLGVKGSGILSVFYIFLGVLVFLSLMYEINNVGGVMFIDLNKSWIKISWVEINWGFFIDNITLAMLLIVLSISGLVYVFSIDYMRGDPHFIRFMCYLSLFTFFMLILILSNNYLQLFIGWEGVGLCSYLLINFWGTRIMANKAAIKAMLINRVGDVGLIVGMLLLLNSYNTLEYNILAVLYDVGEKVDDNIYNDQNGHHWLLELIGIFFLIGAIGKSAQLGLHSWLPEAMEGPTPVSALIHAATMVTAGVFLIIRSSDLYVYCSLSLLVMGIIGALTAFFAGTVGLVQGDIKKVIAYSTCSQLGFMFLTCSCLCFSSALYHLINHAFFKALLFLSAGSLIHAYRDEQDMRKFGGFLILQPITFIGVFIGSFSLLGFPYLTGFYSKDISLELVYEHGTLQECPIESFAGFPFLYGFIYWVGVGSVCLTGAYSGRLIYWVFNEKNRGPWFKYRFVQEGGENMLFSIVLLIIGSLIVGYWGKEFFLSSEFYPVVPGIIKMLPFLFGVFGVLGIKILYDFWGGVFGGRIEEKSMEIKGRKIDKWIISLIYDILLTYQWYLIGMKEIRFWYFLFNWAWRFKEVCNLYLKKIFNLGKGLLIWGDMGILEYWGPSGIGSKVLIVARGIKKLQGGRINFYLFIFSWFLLLILIWYFFEIL